MSESETTTVNDQEQESQTAQSEASSSQTTETLDTKSVNDLIGDDLASTMATKPVKPEVGNQETTESEESTEESQEEATTAESESQSEEESEEEVTQTAETQKGKPNVVKHLRKVIADKGKESKAQALEIEQLRAELQAKVMAPEPVVQRPKEQTPEYWLEQYVQNQRAGVQETDPRQQQIAQKYEQLNDEVKFEKYEQRKAEKQALQNAKSAFVNSLVEIHEMNPFLVKKADSPLGIDVDFTSPIGRVMTTLSLKEHVPLHTANAATIINYAQRANAIVLHQQLNGTGHTVETLKRQQAEGLAKGTITNGTRRAPPQPKPESAKLDGLTKRAQSGRRGDREALANAALGADLGI